MRVPVYRSLDGKRFGLSYRGMAAKAGEYRQLWNGYSESWEWHYFPESDWDRPQPSGEWLAAHEPRGEQAQ